MWTHYGPRLQSGPIGQLITALHSLPSLSPLRSSPAAAPWRPLPPPPRCRPPPQLKPQALALASCRSLARPRPRARSPSRPRPPAAPSQESAPSRLSKAPPSLTRIRNTKMTTTTVWWTWRPWRTRRAAPPPTSPSASPVSFTSVSDSYRSGPFRLRRVTYELPVASPAHRPVTSSCLFRVMNC
jgi:hypothetical protein